MSYQSFHYIAGLTEVAFLNQHPNGLLKKLFNSRWPRFGSTALTFSKKAGFSPKHLMSTLDLFDLSQCMAGLLRGLIPAFRGAFSKTRHSMSPHP